KVPAIGNMMIALLKESSIVSMIGIAELVHSAQLVISETYTNKGFAGLLLGISQEKGIITYNVVEGKISQIKLEGLVTVKPAAIEKIIAVSVNDLFDVRKVRTGISRIFDTGLFEDLNFSAADDPKVPGGIIVTLKLKEKDATP
ncbi:hypothetical protein EON80_24025, partial [bacterium]